MRSWFHPRSWWQAGLLWGTAMFAVFVIKQGLNGGLTLAQIGKQFVVWEAAGLLFGVLLALVLAIFSRTNQFRSRDEGER